MSDNETKVEKSNHVVAKAEADKLKQQPQHREQYSKQDLKLLTDLNAAIQQEKHKGLFWSIILLFAFLVVFVIWSYNSTLEEVTRGQGSIIPSSREQVIQSLDPGILSEMMVKEGDLVEKGQVLLKLDDTRSAAGLRESQAKVQNLAVVVARLEAEAYNRPLVFPSDASKELIERETAVYNSHKQALQESLSSLSESKKLLDREITMTTPMVAKGAVSEVEVLRMRRQSSELQLQIVERQNKYVTDANSELVRVQSELQQARENMAMRADPVERSLIRSPLKGIVKNIRVNTIGGVISAGQDIMEIVPVEEKLVVEAYISPRDVAYVRPGMKALVKLSAYDYAIYGGLDGIVTLLSPDTLHDQKRPSDLKLNANEAYYRVLVTTESSTLTDKNGEVLPIIPGMIATIDIKTGEKTVFQYLIKPITRMKQALQER
ncbi:HlyD family type I secretion periplasmic adaptor subunit [Testudinibacter sp. TR-2022]|uniref:HlyD family type I secretion periplasmic adaptor subunit n=1 Tax=Testudinibacter sp. TR-2022 TaxID=2585029 RepID=UPI0011186C0A|nr:HlyD family type I secretion periplasmic adaptor subunit [Testudinibacter sp. TR-2022]TNH04382.1 HlyD family type I secretion periplasmic adaptor subunit [Pasteurellaceae bacterium Phil11]TNH22532.1 HlyD family type I secretion periplasmic adaptor subunit [Testudinibacter sp. TR-2022]TNH23664.1 HlyD family type I secretion periplasmic adaptor subunit [Testudinibacter sp. TR-2022]